MKNKFITLFLSTFLLAFLWSCKKEENKIYFKGGTAPVLTTSKTGTIAMSFATKDQEAVKLTWTNPAYQFSTGLSSQDVTYQVEIDTTGANFTNPNKKVLTINNNLSLALTQDQLNDYLLNQLQLKAGVPHNIEMRVKSTLANNNGILYSNVAKFSITPYAIPPKVTPPASGELYIVGDATPGGWSNPVPAPAQKFTKVSDTMFELTLPLTGGKSYLFLPVNGSWSAKFGGLGANNTNNPDGDEFKPEGGDLKAPSADGTYKIQVDFQRGKFTLTKI